MTTQRVVPSSFTDAPWIQLGTDLRAALESDAPVLITGQLEVGRLVARALATSPKRIAAPFAALVLDPTVRHVAL